MQLQHHTLPGRVLNYQADQTKSQNTKLSLTLVSTFTSPTSVSELVSEPLINSPACTLTFTFASYLVTHTFATSIFCFSSVATSSSHFCCSCAACTHCSTSSSQSALCCTSSSSCCIVSCFTFISVSLSAAVFGGMVVGVEEVFFCIFRVITCDHS